MIDFLISGSEGYLAKQLVKELVGANKKLLTISNYKQNKIKNITHVKSNMLENFYFKKKVNTILHMASKNVFTETSLNFNEFINSNIKTTINLAEYAKKNGVKNFVLFSSLAVYGDANHKTIKTNSYSKNVNFYGLTKLASEKILEEYRDCFNVYILRVPGVLGSKQVVPWPWLNEIRKKIAANKPINYFNPSKKFNSLTGIEDIKKIVLSIDKLNKNNQFKIYNFGANNSLNLKSILEMIKKKYNSKSRLISKNSPKNSSIIDNEEIEKDLNIKLNSVKDILCDYLKNNS